jgi:hypothetical protein
VDACRTVRTLVRRSGGASSRVILLADGTNYLACIGSFVLPSHGRRSYLNGPSGTGANSRPAVSDRCVHVGRLRQRSQPKEIDQNEVGRRDTKTTRMAGVKSIKALRWMAVAVRSRHALWRLICICDWLSETDFNAHSGPNRNRRTSTGQLSLQFHSHLIVMSLGSASTPLLELAAYSG